MTDKERRLALCDLAYKDMAHISNIEIGNPFTSDEHTLEDAISLATEEDDMGVIQLLKDDFIKIANFIKINNQYAEKLEKIIDEWNEDSSYVLKA